MRRSRGLWIAALLGVGVLVGLYGAVRSSERGTGAAAPRSSRDAPAAASADVAELRQEVAQLRAQVWTQDRRQSGDPDRAASPERGAAAAPREVPESHAEADRQHRAHVASVDEAYRRETIDPRWAGITASAVHQALADDEHLRAAARDVECRARTCRVEIADDGSGRMNRTMLKFAQRVGHELPDVVYDHVEHDGGAATTILYMSR